MDRRTGAILREARRRRQIELSEVEAATKIRCRYLRAIEDEDWDALPGGVYTRGFIRAYASFLGLDGERLADEHRADVEGASAPPRVDLAPSSGGGPRRPVPGLGWIVAAGVVLVAALVIVALPLEGDGGGGSPQPAERAQVRKAESRRAVEPGPVEEEVSVSFSTNAEVWVCMLGDGGEHLVDGQILAAGVEEGPFRSGSFTLSFGNGEVSMLIDGKEAEIPATPSPVGYSIDAGGELTELSEAERPTCL